MDVYLQLMWGVLAADIADGGYLQLMGGGLLAADGGGTCS